VAIFRDTDLLVYASADATKRLLLLLSGITTGTTRTLTIPNASGVLALLSLAQSWTANQTFNAATPTTAMIINLSTSGSPDSLGLMLTDVNGFTTSIQRQPGAVANNLLSLPVSADTLLVGTDETVELLNKTLDSTCALDASTSGVGCKFQDITTATKRLRMVLSGAVGANAFTLANTAARIYTFRDYTADVVLVGNTTAAAGTLGRSALTAQTGNVAATTLLTSSANSSGAFRVSFYIKTTTAGTPAVALTKITVAYNDGSAQTADLLLTAASATPAASAINHDLGTLNAASYGQAIVKAAASTAITFTTTGVYTGAPAYSLDARIEALG
jgi:hypothetical protein